MNFKRFLKLKNEVESILVGRSKKDYPEGSSLWYDHHHSVVGKNYPLSLHASKSSYAASWKVVLMWIGCHERLVDFGCGSGLFAQLAIQEGKRYTLGVDFSETAIVQAKKRNPEYAEKFCVGSLYDLKVYRRKEFDVAVLLEILEHLKRDLFVLEQIPRGKRVILSVPNLLTRGHCRCFSSLEGVEKRYKGLLTIVDSTPVAVSKSLMLYLVNGVRK